ncbi:Sedlin, partial [Syncephalis pseudoplumigaleata]
NNPLFVRNFSQQYPDLKYHYIAHTACDAIEERVSPGGSNANEPYVGLLYAMEDMAVYGYMTNTRIKFIVVITVPQSPIRDADMKPIFRRIHSAYIGLVSNPFHELDTNRPINSSMFSTMIEQIATAVGTPTA